MGLIINPSGTSGSGKTELVRQVMAEYGWERGIALDDRGTIVPVYRKGRDKPLGYRLRHPLGGRPLAVLGHYELTSGGGDTIRAADGGVPAMLRFAREHAESGYDVVLEGLRLSSEYEHSAELARSHKMKVLCLSTPSNVCVRNLISRRRAGRSAWPSIARHVEVEQERVAEACRMLEPLAHLEVLGFDAALARARDLLRLRAHPGRS
jgi:hypothetical protein